MPASGDLAIRGRQIVDIFDAFLCGVGFFHPEFFVANFVSDVALVLHRLFAFFPALGSGEQCLRALNPVMIVTAFQASII